MSSSEDPRLTVWAREQAAQLAQVDTAKRVKIIERTIGVAAKAVRTDLQSQVNATNAQVTSLAGVVSSAVIALGATNVNVTFGTGVVTWGGGFATATSGFYNHGLGKTPIAVIVSPQSQAGTGPISLQLPEAASSTSFRVYACTVPVAADPGYVPPGGTSVPFGWIAIG